MTQRMERAAEQLADVMGSMAVKLLAIPKSRIQHHSEKSSMTPAPKRFRKVIFQRNRSGAGRR
jgi:hypothetical protein